MRYVYLLQSEAVVGQRYVGATSDLKQRLAEHKCRKVSTHVQIRSLEIGDLCRVFG
jgi:predicted GIY-YIG superfamily endonuclease